MGGLALSEGFPVPSADQLAADVRALEAFTRPDRPYTRRAFSDEDRGARGWLAARMAEAGLAVTVDAAANLIGHRPGQSSEPGLMIYQRLTSGASHDANHIAFLCPIGLLFVPCRDARSHCPEEWTDAAHLAAGTRVLLELLLRLDAAPCR